MATLSNEYIFEFLIRIIEEEYVSDILNISIPPTHKFYIIFTKVNNSLSIYF
jgi:hypothetical protein